MARRWFKLPGIHDLSKEQEDARALPLDGRHLIIGGPGTGKSVLALLRAKRLQSENKEYVFLVYNHLLNQSSRQLFGTELVSWQWQSWFLRVFRELTSVPVPRLEAKSDSSWQPFDWNKAFLIAAATEQSERHDMPYLIIDEGQDMPPGFYQCLANLGFENMFVVADDNQRMTEENSRLDELHSALGLEKEDVELTRNYRNTYPVTRLARAFHTGFGSYPTKKDSPPVPARLPMLYAYSADELPEIIHRIAKMSDRMPAKLIGVIAPDNGIRQQFFSALSREDDGLDNGNLNVSTSHSEDRQPMTFDEGGIMVINAQACKGLEFDIVFIAGLHNFRVSHNAEIQAKRLFYVMVARAIDTVIMLRDKDRHCPVEAILPTDTQILERF